MLEHGLHFVGIVKTDTKGFPMQAIKDWFNHGEAARDAGNPAYEHWRGSHTVLQATYSPQENVQRSVYALGWADKKLQKLQTVVFNFGTTLPVGESVRSRKHLDKVHGATATVRSEKRVPWP